MRAYLTKPGLNLCLVNLPCYSPDLNPNEAIWGWARQDVSANLCLEPVPKSGRLRGAFSPICPTSGKKSNAVAEPRCKCSFHLGFGLGSSAAGTATSPLTWEIRVWQGNLQAGQTDNFP